MKKQLFSFILLLSFAASLSAQTVKPTETEKNLRTHVAYLASDKLEGRKTGEQGATFAAGYVANMFAQYKLKAGVSQNADEKTNKSYLQSFPFVTGVEIAETGNEFRLSVNNQPVKAENVQVKAAGFSPNAEIADTEIIFAGYGIAASEQKYDDYAGLDAKNKLVLVFDGTPGASNPRSPLARFDARAKANIAKEKGALGVLLISREARFSDDKLTQMKYDQTLGEAALPTFIVSRETARNIFGLKTDEELKMLEGLLAMKNNSALNIRVGFGESAPRAAFKINLVKKQAESYNVIGILEGRDEILKNEAIVIGAHYDHLGKGGAGSLAVNSTDIHHGADDNASGVAAMLELARQLAKEKKNKRTIIFIAFGGEEEGLIGSKFYVNNPIFPVEKTVAMINLDMVGRLDENKLTVGGIGTASEWKNLLEGKNTLGTVEVNGTQMPITKVTTKDKVETSYPNFALQLNEEGFGPSDHSSFYGKQIPVLFFFTGTHPDYHKPSDTFEKINYEGLMKITGYVGEIVRSIDRNAAKPTYTVAKTSSMGGRMTFNVSLGTVPSYSETASDGLLLDGVRDASPAAKSGLKAGDKIIRLAGREIRNISDYMFVLGEMKAGAEYEVVVRRGAETLTMKIVPAARK